MPPGLCASATRSGEPESGARDVGWFETPYYACAQSVRRGKPHAQRGADRSRGAGQDSCLGERTGPCENQKSRLVWAMGELPGAARAVPGQSPDQYPVNGVSAGASALASPNASASASACSLRGVGVPSDSCRSQSGANAKDEGIASTRSWHGYSFKRHARGAVGSNRRQRVPLHGQLQCCTLSQWDTIAFPYSTYLFEVDSARVHIDGACWGSSLPTTIACTTLEVVHIDGACWGSSPATTIACSTFEAA